MTNDISTATTGVAPTAHVEEYLAYSSPECYDDTEFAGYSDDLDDLELSWIRQHWRAAVVIVEVTVSIIGLICMLFVLMRPPSMPSVRVESATPSTTTTVIAQPPTAATPTPTPTPTPEVFPPVTETPRWTAPDAPPTYEPNTVPQFSAAEDQRFVEQMASENEPVDQDVINAAHDACIMIQSGERPSGVDRTIAATSQRTLADASLLVAAAQLSYANCFNQSSLHHG